MATAIYVIKKVKDHQKGACGGETNVVMLGFVDSTVWHTGYISQSIKINQELVNKTEDQLDKKASRFIKARNKEAVKIMSKIGSAMWKKHVAKVEAEQLATEKEEERLRNHARIHNPVTGVFGKSVTQEIKPDEKS